MRSEFYEHLDKIEALYEVSGVQSVAVNAMNSILSTGLRFKADGSPARGMVLTTVLDWIKNLCLYGFCCFRMLVDEEPGDPNFPVQVPSGRELPVRFSASKLRWVPDLKKAGNRGAVPHFDRRLGRRGWRRGRILAVCVALYCVPAADGIPVHQFCGAVVRRLAANRGTVQGKKSLVKKKYFFYI